MFFIRQAKVEDAPTLLKLAKMVHFISLPADPDIISAKIVRSRRSFRDQVDSNDEREFMFVLEETETGNVIGTSLIIACISGPGRPHTYLKVRRREHYSADLQSGATHLTLQLGTDETGPTEIGGLILSPAYRGHKEKLGSLLSHIRFHLMGLHPEWFSDRVLAEMMGPLTPDSRNLLWEYFGRRFINLSFAEADLFCQHSKEFITSLLPKSEIYATLLPPEARSLIGKVGKETEAAKAILERLGFRPNGHVDPFDGGPYLEARVTDISLITGTRRATLAAPAKAHPLSGFVSNMGETGFRAARSAYSEDGDRVSLPAESAQLIGASPGDTIGLTPLPAAEPRTDTGARRQVSATSGSKGSSRP